MKKLLLPLLLIGAARADFVLKDGDTLAFLGDSITAARGYPKVVEHYTLMRYPERKVRFINAGVGGDTATRCLARLESDVFAKGATVVTVAVGINDIGWGTKADDEHKQLYLDGIRTIIERCREKKVRPIICSPAITAEAPDTAEKGYLQTMADEGLALAKSMGVETIDLQRGMREVQRRVLEHNANAKADDQARLHVKDGIHLDDLGQMAMGYAMLKGLGAPEDVSSASIDFKTSQADTVNCEISGVKTSEREIHFTRLDRGLPLNLGPFTLLQYRWIPLPDGLNRYMLSLKNLPEGEYEIRANDRSLGKASAEALAKGLNIASMTGNGWEPGGPWDVQSCVVKEFVDARDKLTEGRRLHTMFRPKDVKIDPLWLRMNGQENTLIDLQRNAAKPVPYLFSITPSAAAE